MLAKIPDRIPVSKHCLPDKSEKLAGFPPAVQHSGFVGATARFLFQSLLPMHQMPFCSRSCPASKQHHPLSHVFPTKSEAILCRVCRRAADHRKLLCVRTALPRSHDTAALIFLAADWSNERPTAVVFRCLHPIPMYWSLQSKVFDALPPLLFLVNCYV